MLNLGNENIISVHMETARQIVQSPHFFGDVQCIDYSPITSMYGAVHCSSQVGGGKKGEGEGEGEGLLINGCWCAWGEVGWVGWVGWGGC